MKHSLLKAKRKKNIKKLARAIVSIDIFKEVGFRKCWLFDSYEGMSEPTEFDMTGKGKHASKYHNLGLPTTLDDEFKIVRHYIYNMVQAPPEWVFMVKGWFSDTYPIAAPKIDQIDFLHVDCDFYEPVLLTFETFYDKVVDGGYIAIDDYGAWQGCKKAVHEFFEKRNLNIELIKVDSTGVYFKKP
jgi:hypothetical protein